MIEYLRPLLSQKGETALNSCYFTGRLVEKPVISVSATGVAYTRFSIAVHERLYDVAEGCFCEKTSFLPCVAFKDLARDIVDNGYKGQKVTVRCAAEQSMWKDQGKTFKDISFRIKEIDFDGGEEEWHSKRWF